jgi:DNA-binding response OmpR family regulator
MGSSTGCGQAARDATGRRTGSGRDVDERAHPAERDGGRATVLIVEDEPDLADLYADQLADEYETVVATDGEEALESIDGDVDVLLLDRRMPGASGSEVLDAVRDRGYDPRAALVTAVEPGVDLADVPFDDYVQKPVTGAELHATVEGLLALDVYSGLKLELSSKRVRRNVIAGETGDAERADSEEFQRLLAEIEALEEQLAGIERAYPQYEPVFATIK